jgi:hypothetical protein
VIVPFSTLADYVLHPRTTGTSNIHTGISTFLFDLNRPRTMLQYLSLSHFRAPPPKEGRHHTYHPCAPRGRRTTLLRLLLFASVVAISYTVVISLLLPSLRVHAAPVEENAPARSSHSYGRAKSEVSLPVRALEAPCLLHVYSNIRQCLEQASPYPLSGVE